MRKLKTKPTHTAPVARREGESAIEIKCKCNQYQDSVRWHGKLPDHYEHMSDVVVNDPDNVSMPFVQEQLSRHSNLQAESASTLDLQDIQNQIHCNHAEVARQRELRGRGRAAKPLCSAMS